MRFNRVAYGLNNKAYKRLYEFLVTTLGMSQATFYELITGGKIHLCGGALSSLIRQEKTRDYDFYFADLETVDKILLTVHKFMDPDAADDHGRPIFENFNPDRIRTLSSNPRELSYSYSGTILNPTTQEKVGLSTPYCISGNNGVQLVVGWFGTLEQILEMFDFSHCCAGLTLTTTENLPQSGWPKTVQIGDRDFFYCNSAKVLQFRPTSPFPLASLFRVTKFVNRGFKISPLELLKITAAAFDREALATPRSVERHLKGVDVQVLQRFAYTLRYRFGVRDLTGADILDAIATYENTLTGAHFESLEDDYEEEEYVENYDFGEDN